MQSNEKDTRIRKNIPKNVARAVRQWEQINRTEATKEVRDYYQKSFEGAEYERIRRENIKRGVK